jgi:pectinesterase
MSPPFSLTLSLVFFILLAPLLLLAQSPSPSTSPPPSNSSSAACKATLYPKLCRLMLSTIRSSPSDPYNYGKFSIKQNLKLTRKLAKVFSDFLKRHQSSSSLNHEEFGALVDCNDLNKLNVDYLESISDELKSATTSLSDTELVDKIESYLSAVTTNHYTCFDGLVVTKSNIANALAFPLKEATQFYSVSLGLVTEALNKNLKRNKTRKHGLPNKSFKVRQPLEKLIKVIFISILCYAYSIVSTLLSYSLDINFLLLYQYSMLQMVDILVI